jgi:hypothetical protein
LGDAYEYLIGQFAAGGGKKAGCLSGAYLKSTNQSHKQNQTRYPIFSFYPNLGLDYQVRQYKKGC